MPEQKSLPGMSALKPRKPRGQRSTYEFDQQCALIRWRDLFVRTEPRLRWLHSSLNGVPLTPGVAMKAKRSGMTRGVWDLFLPERGQGDWRGFSGLYIEMKSKTGRLRAEQEEFLQEHTDPGDFVFCIAEDWTEAARCICDYLDLAESHPARKGAL